MSDTQVLDVKVNSSHANRDLDALDKKFDRLSAKFERGLSVKGGGGGGGGGAPFPIRDMGYAFRPAMHGLTSANPAVGAQLGVGAVQSLLTGLQNTLRRGGGGGGSWGGTAGGDRGAYLRAKQQLAREQWQERKDELAKPARMAEHQAALAEKEIERRRSALRKRYPLGHKSLTARGRENFSRRRMELTHYEAYARRGFENVEELAPKGYYTDPLLKQRGRGGGGGGGGAGGALMRGGAGGAGAVGGSRFALGAVGAASVGVGLIGAGIFAGASQHMQYGKQRASYEQAMGQARVAGAGLSNRDVQGLAGWGIGAQQSATVAASIGKAAGGIEGSVNRAELVRASELSGVSSGAIGGLLRTGKAGMGGLNVSEAAGGTIRRSTRGMRGAMSDYWLQKITANTQNMAEKGMEVDMRNINEFTDRLEASGIKAAHQARVVQGLGSNVTGAKDMLMAPFRNIGAHMTLTQAAINAKGGDPLAIAEELNKLAADPQKQLGALRLGGDFLAAGSLASQGVPIAMARKLASGEMAMPAGGLADLPYDKQAVAWGRVEAEAETKLILKQQLATFERLVSITTGLKDIVMGMANVVGL